MDKQDILKKYFGHTAFRAGQGELIDAILAGRDALGIMPTGGGKSLCYQVPALLMEGVTLVISPLISLMKDQVMALKNAGVAAAFLNSSLTGEQMKTVYRQARAGAYKILYLAPERLEGEGFIALAQSLHISLLAVDEAHCISQWGQDFRPSYLKILDFMERLPRRPVLTAFTATATVQVREDIRRILRLEDPCCVTTGFDRPNLNFEVLRPKDKNVTLRALMKERQGRSGIIYCSTRTAVERVCDSLCAAGVPATRYHAGLPDGERRQNQEDFIYDRCPVMVATNAFGMGIDKSNVGFVLHYNMPKSLEAYYQEAGRAGRDGERANCILLYSAGDIATAKFFIQSAGAGEGLSAEEQALVTRRDYARLDVMVRYCKTTGCLRGHILDYFGQTHPTACGNCGNCRGKYTERDITAEAQMILSCVKRIRDKLGYAVGATLVIHTICGSREKRVLELGLHTLSTYGLLRAVSRGQVKAYVEYLESNGYLHTDPVHGGVELTEKAGAVLFRGQALTMTVREGSDKEQRTIAADTEGEDGLFTALKALRFRLAQREGVPAYVIFSNATLLDMAAKMPHTMTEFLEVSGVGENKARRFGKQFLEEIAKQAEA
ncbi:MAG: DNA helicase RecQ [Oscillospiraceae bacterium]